YRQAVPPVASPLERGNDLYVRGRYEEAFAAYEAGAGDAGDAGAEARYKRALCQLTLNRLDEAATLLERVAVEPGRGWPLLASCQRWLLRVRQGHLDDADALFDALGLRFGAQDLIDLVPEDLRAALLDAGAPKGGLAFFVSSPRLLRDCERALQLVDR